MRARISPNACNSFEAMPIFRQKVFPPEHQVGKRHLRKRHQPRLAGGAEVQVDKSSKTIPAHPPSVIFGNTIAL